MCQTLKSLKPDMRKLFSNVFCLKFIKEMEEIMDEVIDGQKDNIDEIINKFLINHSIICLTIQIHKDYLKFLMK